MTINDGPAAPGSFPPAPPPPGAGTGPAGDDHGEARQRAEAAAGTAKDQAHRVAGTTQEEARKVAGEAASQARGLVDDALTQLESQSREQKDRLAAALGDVGDDLRSMSDQGGGTASGLVAEAADRVSALASHLDGREPREMLGDLRDFARRRPGTFLAGAFVGGVVAGRLLRGARQDDPRPSTGTGTTPRTSARHDHPSAAPAQPAGLAEDGPAYDPVQAGIDL